jgi:hypothetical protein
LWLKESEDSTNEAAITFGEKAGVPGPGVFLDMVASKVTLTLCNSTQPTATKGCTALPLIRKRTSFFGLLGEELTATIDSARPFSLNLAATFGIFGEDPAKPKSLLKYYSSADVVKKPTDWFLVQDWDGTKGLDLSIRDPWMLQPGISDSSIASRLTDSGDQCAAHAGPVQDGEACVVAVVRFQGKLLSNNVTVSTFTDDGNKLRASISQYGTLILKVPLNKSVFASVNYREMVPGKYDGKDYAFVDHWATTYARILRPPSEVIV